MTLTEAQVTLGGLTREIIAGRKPVEGNGPLWTGLWTELAQAGVLSAALPSSAGGDDLGLLEQCSILTEVGRAGLGLPYLASIVAGASTIAEFGSAGQLERWAAPAGRGEAILTAALAGPAVKARPTGDRWVLDGACPTVPVAPSADLVLVPVDGTGVFLVSPADSGVVVQPQHIAGGPGEGFVDLSSVELGPDRLLAHPGAAVFLRERATVGLCATQLGVLERALEITAEYARTRVQFGKPIGSFQAVAQRLADAYIDVEGVRLTMWQAAWLLASGLSCPTELATAKFWAADAGHRVAHTAVHLHGGIGIDVDHIVQRYFLAAKYQEFTLGGATEQLLALGSALVMTPLEA